MVSAMVPAMVPEAGEVGAAAADVAGVEAVATGSGLQATTLVAASKATIRARFMEFSCDDRDGYTPWYRE
jgi:hypothetical protein